MMDRQRVIKEILEANTRRYFDNSSAELLVRIKYLEYSYRRLDPKNKELLRYFPIALVACIQSYFQMAIKEIIDLGEPYLTNSKQLMPKKRLDFDIVKSLHGRTITIGDIIAHYLPVSKLDHILSPMSQLLSINFKESVSRVYDRWDVEVRKKPRVAIISDIEESCRYVDRTFQLRHIFCHEVASKFEIVKDEIDNCFDHCVLLLKASDALISQTLFPDAPLTQMEMNMVSAEDFTKEKMRLDSALDEVFEVVSDKQRMKFIEANNAWKVFLEASAEVEGLEYEGGTMRPTIECLALSRLTRDRRKQVEKLLAFLSIP